jgi:hypothetical protein
LKELLLYFCRDDEDDEDQQTPRRRGGRQKKDNTFSNLDDIDDVGTPNSSKTPSVSGVLNSEATGLLTLIDISVEACNSNLLFHDEYLIMKRFSLIIK